MKSPQPLHGGPLNAPNVYIFGVGRNFAEAHSLHRLTHERPAAFSPNAEPTQRWCSDCGKEGANVTGKSAQSVGLHPSRALGLESTEAGFQLETGTVLSHPAELWTKGMQ